MPRDNAGTHSLPAGNPVTTGATIGSTWANNTLTDLSTELTDSLSRSGKGPMSAPLLVPNGAVNLPALAFSAETDTGIYRAGADDVRVALGGADALKVQTTGVTALQGATVTQSQADTAGVTSTGNGTGAGVVATGGATSGAGVVSTGGATSGAGVVSTGGAPNGIGVVGVGDGSGPGVQGTGGDGSGHGLYGLGGGPNGIGCAAGGTGTGEGVNATGGPSSGIGGLFTGGAPDGAGVKGTGVGNGAGGKFYNSATSTSAAVEGWSASASAAGAYVSNSNGGHALEVATGHAKFTGGNPDKTTGYTNMLTPMHIVKAWGVASCDGAGNTTFVAGSNIASVATSATSVLVTIANDMADGNYAVGVNYDAASTTGYTTRVFTRTAGSFYLGINPLQFNGTFFFFVFGAQ
jgi:hypothetical protein